MTLRGYARVEATERLLPGPHGSLMAVFLCCSPTAETAARGVWRLRGPTSPVDPALARGGVLKTGQGKGMTLTSHKLRLRSRHTAGIGCRQPSGQGNRRVFEFLSFAFTLI